MTNHRKPSDQLPFTLNRPIVGRSLPFAFLLGKTSTTTPTASTPPTPKPLPLTQTRLGVAMDGVFLTSIAKTVANCRPLTVNGVRLANCVGIGVSPSVPVFACEFVKVRPFVALATCYQGHFTPVVGLSYQICPYIKPMQALTACTNPTTTQVIKRHGCITQLSDKIRPLSACQNPKTTAVLPLSACQSHLNKGKSLANCRTLTVQRAVGVPCKYYPLPPPPLPPNLQVCPIRPPSDKLPFHLTRKRGKFESYALPFELNCWHKTDLPSPNDNPNNPKNPITKTGYIMHHTITATIGGLTIDPLSFSIKTDIQSFCWQGQIEIPQKDFDKLNKNNKLNKPLGQEPLISVMIDDVLFVILAEEIAHHRQFVGNTVSLSGRSVTAHLSKEYATANPLPSGSLYASQIVNAQLENIGITADFGLTDWQIGKQVYSTTGKTPIGVLDDLAKAVGGFVGSHHHLPTLTLAPVYKVGAWELATATPDRIMPLSVIHKMSLATQKNPRHNTVTLIGQTGGIVYRENEGQDRDLGVIDNALLNDESIPMRGAYELSKTGTHTQITIHIRLSNKHGLGLANLGEIWQINDELNGNLSPFKGVVTAIQIDVKNEKGVPQIWQVVTLDRYDDV